MLYMKEDDMDEMLRKAAENYDVDVNSAADWNAVYVAVHETELKPAAKEKKKRRFAFWWLLLIPLGWLANTAYNNYYKAHHQTNINSETDAKINGGTANVNSSKNSQNNLSVDKAKEENTNRNLNIGSLQQKTPYKANNIIVKNNKTLSTDNYSLKQSAEIQQKQISPAAQSLNDPNGQTLSRLNTVENNHSNDVIQNNSPANNDQNNPGNTSINSNNQNSNPNTVTADKGVAAKAKSSINKKEKNNSHYFYTGLIAGGDLSFIKYQKIQPVGYSIGLLAGYQFNKLSIESGLFFDKKNYYTTGEYFDKSKIPGFSNGDLHYANGYCKMFEIPLNVKYDFSTKKKHTWFATAGLSSYLMSKEYYHYAYSISGQEHNDSYPYYHTTKDWFSVFNVSVGYQLQTGAKTNLRIEPYYKTTLKGVGTGNLHIISAGVNIGIARKIP